MNGINLKGLLLATLAVLGIDLFSETVLMNLFGAFPDRPTEEQIRAAVAALYRHGGYLTGALLFGTASTILGGYLAARLAQSLPYYNALAFGAFYALLGLVIGSIGPVTPPAWLRGAVAVLTICAALAGAHLYKKSTATDS
jgi:hypothetical protein